MNFFSKKPTAIEALRESKREMANATRGIEKETGALQLEKKKLVAEIKRTAKTGNEVTTKTLAWQLVRLRQKIAKAMYAQSSIAVGMKGASKAMAAMNKYKVEGLGDKVDIFLVYYKTEMMLDAIDDALDNDEAEEETEELTNQLSAASKERIKTKNTENVSSSDIDNLKKSLAALRS
ncbi:hypothetical protein VNO77_16362 [Canavalia gladiata]|uniref:Uncharacterized protein n=1 Tax=Canavalia gladiata TaxID=3824 RepID=A0AAN9M0W1_CANGL